MKSDIIMWTYNRSIFFSRKFHKIEGSSIYDIHNDVFVSYKDYLYYDDDDEFWWWWW